MMIIKKILILIVTSILICTFIIPATSAINIDDEYNYISSQIKNDSSFDNTILNIISKLVDPEPCWFPGFFFVQLLKAVIAIILIILIIFNSFQL